MKKVLAVLFVVALVGVTFSSCKKECTCTEKVTGYVDNSLGKVSKADCTTFEEELNDLGGLLGQEWTCKQ